MTFLAAYLFLGFVICIVVHMRGPHAGENLGAVLSVFDERSWLVALFWPIWLIIYAIERGFPKEENKADVQQVSFIGFRGIVVSELRPLGKVRVVDQVVDARAEVGVIPEGSPVILLGRVMNEYVAKQEANQTPEPMSGLTPGHGSS